MQHLTLSNLPLSTHNNEGPTSLNSDEKVLSYLKINYGLIPGNISSNQMDFSNVTIMPHSANVK